MLNWKDISIPSKTTIMEALRKLNNTGKQFLVVTNQEDQLIGCITDGDIRRGILNSISFNESVQSILNRHPYSDYEGKSMLDYQKEMEEKKLRHLPVVTKENKIVDILIKDDIFVKEHSNKIVLMVGGLGARLRPLTEHIPKPMLKIGNKPILQIIIESFKSHGFVNFVLCVNYKKEIIQSYFQNGDAFGVNIEYIVEDKPLGTAGALSLLREDLTEPIFVMNGDLLTQVDFSKLLEFHVETQSSATMCVREYEYQIPYGVIGTNEYRLISIQEKPVKKEYVNAGIYMISPETLKLIPYHEYYDMPDLFNKLIEINSTISAFPIHEYWMDIGQIADYEQANKDYESVKVND